MRAILIFFSLVLAANGQGQFDILVGERTRVQRCVLVGEFPRAIAVGHPGGFSYAFDTLRAAPVFVWHGGFLNYSGEIKGRGGYGCKILGVKQPLGTAEIPFRVGSPDRIPASIRFGGYRLDPKSGSPTFSFETDGVAVEQSIRPRSPHIITIDFSFPKPGTRPRYYLIDPSPHLGIELGAGLRWSASGVVEIPPTTRSASITVHLRPSNKTFVRPIERLTGEEIFRNYCSACHSTDGTKLIGPTFEGLMGRKQTVTRAGKKETITTDAAYIRESVTNPQASIVEGYEAVPMADFSAILNDEQITALIEYLKTLE